MTAHSHPLKQMLRRLLPAAVTRRVRRLRDASADYRILSGPADAAVGSEGWKHPRVAERQHAAFAPLLKRLGDDNPREDFIALAEAVHAANLHNPDILELGCGSGWNFQVLSQLYGKPFQYSGLDVSTPMIAIAQREFPAGRFVAGDALKTGFPDECCDILVSGTLLMHLADYRQAVRESVRLARRFCVFHTVPVMQRRKTTFLQKSAYGQSSIEVIFNEAELVQTFTDSGCTVIAEFESLPYDLASVVGEPTTTRTYLCSVDK